MELTTKINFLADHCTHPRIYQYSDDGSQERLIEYVQHEVKVGDGRAAGLTMIENGLELVAQNTSLRPDDFFDHNKITGTFYPECEQLIKDAVGASKVVVFDHIVRNKAKHEQKQSLKDGETIKTPVFIAHNDYTKKSAPIRIRDLSKHKGSAGSYTLEKPPIDEREVPSLLKKRFVFLNVWRNIAETPIRDTPLAVCDGTSMTEADLVPCDLVYRDRVGEVCIMKHKPEQKWYYFPDMNYQEAMLLKCYDTAEHAGRWTGHSAVDAKPEPGTFTPRASIEVRTIAFFDDENPKAKL